MAHFIVYGRHAWLREASTVLSDTLHAAAQRTLGLPADKRFHRFVPLEAWQMVAPADRSERYLIIEVHMFAGRTPATRKGLVRAVIDDLGAALSLAPVDVEITIFESARENWGIRGQHGDEMKLPYEVNR
jgi:hypothetical protein